MRDTDPLWLLKKITIFQTKIFQASAILMLLERYGWHSFTIITGMIAGHRNFDQASGNSSALTDFFFHMIILHWDSIPCPLAP